LASRRTRAASIANPAPRTAEAGAEFRSHALILPGEAAGLRFDQALARALPEYSRARLKAWIDDGAVQVDGRALRAKDKVLGGEQVRIEARLPVEERVAPEAIPLGWCSRTVGCSSSTSPRARGAPGCR
jgi:23S rRNA pseudouridine1911/1915/1917 synthase